MNCVHISEHITKVLLWAHYKLNAQKLNAWSWPRGEAIFLYHWFLHWMYTDLHFRDKDVRKDNVCFETQHFYFRHKDVRKDNVCVETQQSGSTGRQEKESASMKQVTFVYMMQYKVQVYSYIQFSQGTYSEIISCNFLVEGVKLVHKKQHPITVGNPGDILSRTEQPIVLVKLSHLNSTKQKFLLLWLTVFSHFLSATTVDVLFA